MSRSRRGPEELAVARAVSRDRLAEVYAAEWPFLTRFLSNRVRDRDRHVVEDLAQNTFLRAWPGLAEVHGDAEGSLRPWLAAIARRVVSSHYVADGRHQRPAADAEVPVAADSVVWDTARRVGAPVVSTSGGAVASPVWEALDSLPARTRMAVELRVANGMTQRAVAEEMGCSNPTVERHAVAGLAALRQKLTATPSPAVGVAGGEVDPMARARRAVTDAHHRVTTHAAQARARQAARWHAEDHAAAQDREHAVERGAAVLDTDGAR